MLRPLMRAGYDFSWKFTFDVDGEPEDLSAATISISLKNEAKTSELITDTSQTNTGDADWANGIVVLRFTKTQTSGLATQNAFIEISVTKTLEKIPYRDIAIDVETGVNLS